MINLQMFSSLSGNLTIYIFFLAQTLTMFNPIKKERVTMNEWLIVSWCCFLEHFKDLILLPRFLKVELLLKYLIYYFISRIFHLILFLNSYSIEKNFNQALKQSFLKIIFLIVSILRLLKWSTISSF